MGAVLSRIVYGVLQATRSGAGTLAIFGMTVLGVLLELHSVAFLKDHFCTPLVQHMAVGHRCQP